MLCESRLEGCVGKIVRDRIAQIRTVDGCGRRLRYAGAVARACAVVEHAHTGRFRGLRRPRGEGGDQGSADVGNRRMQREIRRSAQVRRRLRLLRLYAEPQLRYRGSQSDERRTKAHRRTIHRLSRQAAAKLRRGVARGKAGAANRRAARKGVPAGARVAGCQAKGDGGRSQGARQSAMRQTFHLLLRVAGAFRENHESEESTVWFVPGQSQTRWLVFQWRGHRSERGALTNPGGTAI